MRIGLAVIGMGALLAACNNGPSTEESARRTGDIRLENASSEEVLKQAVAARDKNQIQPGEWENSYQLVSIDMPGVPAPLRAQMEAETKKPPETRRECKRPDDAKGLDLTKMAGAAKDCTFPKYVVAGGRIDAQMICKGPFGPVRMTILGTQSKTSYELTMTQAQNVPGQSAESKMVIKASGKRIGECKA